MDSSERRRMILARLRKEGAEKEGKKKKKRATDTKEGFIARYGEEAWERKKAINKKWAELHKDEIREYQRKYREQKKILRERMKEL